MPQLLLLGLILIMVTAYLAEALLEEETEYESIEEAEDEEWIGLSNNSPRGSVKA